MIDYSISTHLMRTIENARPNIPIDAYTLLTTIARDLTEILDKSGNGKVALSADFEYILESMAKQDLPDSIDQYLRFPKDSPKQIAKLEELFLDQLATILESVEKIKSEVQDQMLSEMKSHSRYIKDKFAPVSMDDELSEDDLFDVTSTQKRAMIEQVEGPNSAFLNRKAPVAAEPAKKKKLFGLF